ncbi:clindamycin resistance transfer factor BtgB, partial [Escherichia coli]|nr:clindamycin resistance transfer factor BtgB [Escherichia coli]
KKGEEVQPLFNQFRDYVSAREVTFKIDNNKAKLSRTDAKFYVITVSPSEKELRCMGRTPQECAEALRRYIRQDVMRNYAEGFGKGLKSDDVEYYAKIHFNRDGESDSDMHAHIIVSRKDRSNTRKLSPKTNHTGKKNCGNVKGGFDRTDFFRKCETSFDKSTGYDRSPEQTFDYLNTMKNGTPKEIFQMKEWAERVNHERLERMKAEWSRSLQEQHQEQGREENQQQGNSISQVLEINQAPQRKKQQEEELDQPRKKSRGFGMVM